MEAIMADLNKLAAGAKRKLAAHDANCEADAIRKAITGSGVTFKPDVERLMSEVGTVFARNKRDEQRTSLRRP